MIRSAFLALTLAQPAIAAEFLPLSGDDIHLALTDRKQRYTANTVQDFRASGRTLYTVSGRESWGYWTVRGDQYCSQWPPSDLWECYDIARAGNMIRFIGKSGETTDGSYVD